MDFRLRAARVSFVFIVQEREEKKNVPEGMLFKGSCKIFVPAIKYYFLKVISVCVLHLLSNSSVRCGKDINNTTIGYLAYSLRKTQTAHRQRNN